MTAHPAANHSRGGVFLGKANEQLARVGSSDLDTQKRLLHTLKGNASLVGFDVVAGMCNKLEDKIVDSHTLLDFPVPEIGPRFGVEALERTNETEPAVA